MRGFATAVLLTASVFIGLRATPAQPPGGPPFGGPGGPGGMFGQQKKLVATFDKDGDGRLNTAERQAAREAAKKTGGGRGFGPPGGGGRGRGGEPGKPGPRVSPADVKNYPDTPLYEGAVLRTLFLDFENTKDWEAELQDFHGTDVEVPCTLTVDGKTYPNVGVHFRGMSSYGMVPAGSKRSLNLDLDFADPKQRLYGYKTLNLLNAHEDASYLSSVLYSDIARKYTAAPRANFVKVVINGESWGVYVNVQQFNKEFLQENFKTTKGTRWKVRGSPGGGGGLEYAGDRAEDYKRRFEIKSGDNEKAWQALIGLCKTLAQTPPDKLETELPKVLDVDSLLWFLALDVALINNDGYWVRASDYSIYLDPKGKFHIIPHDMNEAFHPAGGPGFGGPGGGFPRPGEVMPLPLQDVLRLTDEQKKQVAALQKDVDGKLGGILTTDQGKQMKDMRERAPGGFGGGRGPGAGGPGGGAAAGGVSLDPLVAVTDARKPLRSKVLAVPAWREAYLRHIRTIAADSLDWKNLGPAVARYRGLIEKEVEIDTRKLESFEAFLRTTADETSVTPGRGREFPLRTFAEERRKFLLNHPDVKNAMK